MTVNQAKNKIAKLRLDAALVARGLAPSQAKAAAQIMAGDVLLDGQLCLKTDRAVTAANHIELKVKFPYASRGALKIAKAVTDFAIAISGGTFLDVGISNGGFSDFLLQQGAAHGAGVDVNIGQVADKLKADKRLILIEKNARFLVPADIPFSPDLIVADLSFISVAKVLPALAAFPGARLLIMVKPQFEARRGQVGKNGVIRDPQRVQDILARLAETIQALGFYILGVTPAGITGKKGNQEYFYLLTRNSIKSDTH